jgi:hypothetical protein
MLCAQNVTLVDFGASPAANTFGLDGWNTALLSDNLSYTAKGNGGVVCSTDPGEFGDYRGVRGTARNFTPGERIVVTWYNDSDAAFRFTARISFLDTDNADEAEPEMPWITMRSFTDYRQGYTEMQPHSFAKTVFNIADSGLHKSNGMHSSVNVTLAIEWGSTAEKLSLVCDKIELWTDADIIPPSQPTGLSATVLSDSKIRLNWNAATDNVDVTDYLVYRDGEIEGYARTNAYTCVFLEANLAGRFSVVARDAVGNMSEASSPKTASTDPFQGGNHLINPARLEYQGVFAVPSDFGWGGEAVAYYPDGDGGQSGADGFPGSLFVTNVNQPENGLVGEISIPAPVIPITKTIEDLPVATVLRQPVNIRPANVNSWYPDFVDIWRTGLEYVPEENRLYSSWSIHYTVTEAKNASISAVDLANLSGGTKYGAWYLGNAAQPPLDAMANDWLFAIPQTWADVNCSGRSLITGRFRDGGLSGLGPTMYAFAPVGASPPAANGSLPITTLLEYGPVAGTDNYNYPNSIDDYNHADTWREAVWMNAGQQNAVAVIGNKGLGDNWYGIRTEWMPHEWFIADVPFPDVYQNYEDGKGWRCHNLQPMIIFYDPSDLADVAAGRTASYTPQPYAALRIPKERFFGYLHEIFSAAFDPENRLLYLTEFVLEKDGILLIHVWRVRDGDVSGDVDGDGELDLNDLIMVLKILSGHTVNGVNLKADINGDGDIGEAEAVYILQSLVKIRNP